MENKKISLFDANTIELHYWMNDGTHSMDAFIQNECEREFLGILKEISSVFEVEVEIESPFFRRDPGSEPPRLLTTRATYHYTGTLSYEDLWPSESDDGDDDNEDVEDPVDPVIKKMEFLSSEWKLVSYEISE